MFPAAVASGSVVAAGEGAERSPMTAPTATAAASGRPRRRVRVRLMRVSREEGRDKGVRRRAQSASPNGKLQKRLTAAASYRRGTGA
ncbi:hypothetical protein GCM10010250_49970 [Streptomyces althioticus]|nr:hypothetical protein GCM10010250_49970 [Streptomyces althioticus]